MKRKTWLLPNEQKLRHAFTRVTMRTHRDIAIKIISPGLYATYNYWPVKCFSYVMFKIMLFNVTCRHIEKNRLQCASGLWTLLCLENFWYSNQALHFLCNFQHAQPCTLFQRLWYYPEAITKGKKLKLPFVILSIQGLGKVEWQGTANYLQSTFS